MVSKIFHWGDIKPKQMKGIKKVGNKIYIKTVSNKFKEVERGSSIWYRGKGRWSVRDLELDRMRVAKTKIGKGKWSELGHKGDKPGSNI